MKSSRTWISALGFALVLSTAGSALPGCVVTGRARFTSGAMVVHEQPPAPRAENPGSRSGFIWISGRWDNRSNQWVWMDGRWERQRASQQWVAGEWTRRGDSWHWVEGHWDVQGGGGYDAGRPDVVDHRGNPDPTYTPGRPDVVDHRAPPPPVVTVVANPNHYPTVAPPAPRTETSGRRTGFVWIAGRWNWTNGAYAWIDGHWERQRAKGRWNEGKWDFNGNFYIWIEGSWN